MTVDDGCSASEAVASPATFLATHTPAPPHKSSSPRVNFSSPDDGAYRPAATCLGRKHDEADDVDDSTPQFEWTATAQSTGSTLSLPDSPTHTDTASPGALHSLFGRPLYAKLGTADDSPARRQQQHQHHQDADVLEVTKLTVSVDSNSDAAVAVGVGVAAPPRKRGRLEASLGLILCGASAFFFALASMFVKIASKEVPVAYIIFSRGFLQTVLAVASMLLQGVMEGRWVNLLGQRGIRHLLFCRGLFGAFAVGLFFFTVTQLPLGDASAVFFTSPIVTALLAYLVLGEAWAASNWIIAFVSFCGVMLIARPSALFPPSLLPPDPCAAGGHRLLSDHELYPLHAALDCSHRASPPHLVPRTGAVCLAFVGAISGAVALCFVRLIGKRTEPLVLVNYFGLCTSAVSLALVMAFTPPQTVDFASVSMGSWLATVGVGFLGFSAQWCLNKGLQLEKAGPAAFMRNLDVALAFIFQVCILGVPLDPLSVTGAGLVVGSASVMVLRKCVSGQ
ncbi:unnamed protein product [Vitrella brassicaformis CCMP3155]|uniref:EamA domain-containing protein n=2 Tax=Vitrella brassicaformis TaxID=1169539 RepID=A0A0G4EZP9_VITBC|nr:unnamed protein product [Vitrella brassicaformis CCMP3155]|eukprot:CEM04491.1 unnamed protein product [Vitrella brassicaformis CCMP3155]